MSLKLPATIEVELKYQYLEKPVVYIFPRLQKRDTDVDEKERLLGNGKNFKSSLRLSLLVDDIQGLEDLGLPIRNADGKFETEDAYRYRVERFFDSEDGQEMAEHALLYRVAAATPRSLFRSSEDNRMAVDLRGQEAGRPVVPLSDVRHADQGPAQGVPEVPADAGSGGPKAKN